jgi:hypothetical protein
MWQNGTGLAPGERKGARRTSASGFVLSGADDRTASGPSTPAGW